VRGTGIVVPFRGNTVQETLPLILTVAVLLMALGAISGVVVIAGLALYDERSEAMERRQDIDSSLVSVVERACRMNAVSMIAAMLMCALLLGGS
jgi:hypothetical protein